MCGAPRYNKNQDFFYYSALSFLVHWFMVSKSQDECFRSRHYNYVQDPHPPKSGRNSTSSFWSLLSGNKRPFSKPQQNSPYASLARPLFQGCPLLQERLEQWPFSFSILCYKSRQGWSDLEMGTESAKPGFCPKSLHIRPIKSWIGGASQSFFSFIQG